jgi:hypothetical protein
MAGRLVAAVTAAVTGASMSILGVTCTDLFTGSDVSASTRLIATNANVKYGAFDENTHTTTGAVILDIPRLGKIVVTTCARMWTTRIAKVTASAR